MLISIITPVYNSAKNIEANVKSILAQTYQDFNHIIIDNLSKDNSVSIIKKMYNEAGMIEKLKIISEKDNGISDAFNKGIKSAEGEIIGILNSDDYYYDHTVFEQVIEPFRQDDNLFVHGNVLFIDPVYGTNIRSPLLCPITTAMPYNHPTMFFRKSVYDNYGLFDTAYKFAMDFEFICRLEHQIPDFRKKGWYIQGDPLAVMRAGGTSWENETESIKEVKSALTLHGTWNGKARSAYLIRRSRVLLKNIFRFFKLNIITKKWRKIKWD